jgi:predicted  nucleic acid-binding Zn-ribbon protein
MAEHVAAENERLRAEIDARQRHVEAMEETVVRLENEVESRQFDAADFEEEIVAKKVRIHLTDSSMQHYSSILIC